MRYLVDIPLKYKFWLVNSISFLGMLALSMAAVYDQLPSGAGWSDFGALLWHKIPYYAPLVFVLMVLVLLASQMLIVFVSKPMQNLREAMLKVSQEGDLSVRTERRSGDEVGQVSLAFNAMVHDLSILVTEVRAAALSIDIMSKNLAEDSRGNANSVEVQQQAVDQLAGAMNQLAQISQDVHQNADENNKHSLDSVNVARSGQSQVDFVVGSIDKLANEIRDGAGVVQQLADETGSIGSALDVIKSIAEQTNLLALNAAIEAARAGEQGRGFAVVADEVRSLAQRVQESTEQIKSMLDQLQKSSHLAVSVMNARSDEAAQCVEQANEAGAVINEMADNAQHITDANGAIAVSVSQQSNTIRGVNSNVEKLRDQMESILSGVKSNADTVQTLSDLSSRLAHSVEHLKL